MSRLMAPELEDDMVKPAGSAALVLVGAATPLHPEPALFEAMIQGWRRQHAARRLSVPVTRSRELTIRRFQDFCGSWPWEWRSTQLEAWVAQGGWAHSTIRSYEGAIALFLAYVCDPHYSGGRRHRHHRFVARSRRNQVNLHVHPRRSGHQAARPGPAPLPPCWPGAVTTLPTSSLSSFTACNPLRGQHK